MKPRCPNNERHHNDLVLAVLESATVPMGPSAIAKRLELQGTHWWAYSPNCRVLIYAILQRVKAVHHAGGKFTSPLSALITGNAAVPFISRTKGNPATARTVPGLVFITTTLKL